MSSNDSNVTEDTGDCVSFNSEVKCDAVWASRRVVAITSMISCVSIVFVLVALKRYKFLQQRLVLYLTVGVFFNTFHYVWGDYHFSNRARNGELIEFCRFQGFYHILTAWIAFLWVCIITFNIFWITVVLKRTGRKFEYVYIAVDLIPPVIMAIIPFTVDAYGPAGLWCWISSVRDGERSGAGIALQFSLFYGPWLFLCIIMATVLISVRCVIYYRLRKTGQTGDYGGPMVEAQMGLWKEEIKPLMPFPWIYIAAFIFPVINRLRLAAGYSDPASSVQFALWFLHAISLPMPGFIFALVIIIDKKTLKELKKTLAGWCRGAECNAKTNAEDNAVNYTMKDIAVPKDP